MKRNYFRLAALALAMTSAAIFTSCEKDDNIVLLEEEQPWYSGYTPSEVDMPSKSLLKAVTNQWDGLHVDFDGSMSPVANTGDAFYDGTVTYDSGTGSVKDVANGSEQPNAYVFINSGDVMPTEFRVEWNCKSSDDATHGVYVYLHRTGYSSIGCPSDYYENVTDTDWHSHSCDMVDEIQDGLDSESLEWSDIDYLTISYVAHNQDTDDASWFDNISFGTTTGIPGSIPGPAYFYYPGTQNYTGPLYGATEYDEYRWTINPYYGPAITIQSGANSRTVTVSASGYSKAYLYLEVRNSGDTYWSPKRSKHITAD
jgi:hypothetical protein